MGWKRARTLSALVALVFFLVLAAGPALAAEKKTLQFGVVPWSESLAVGSVIEYLLVNELDQPVKVTNPDIGVAYTAIKNKDLDLFVEAWLPVTHEAYWEKLAHSICDFGPIYEDASLGWAVPTYIPESEFNSVADMGKEAVKEKCGGRIVGIDPGSGLMQHSALMMKKYPELEGWKLVEGSGAAMVAELKRAIQRKNWIVVTLWRPHFAFARFDIRYLDEPKNILGDEERIHMIGRKDFMGAFPSKVSQFLSRFYLPIAEVDALTNLYDEHEDGAAQMFVKQNPKLVKYWLTGEIE